MVGGEDEGETEEWTPWRGVKGKPEWPKSVLTSLVCLNSF